jgi:hypothetical protein
MLIRFSVTALPEEKICQTDSALLRLFPQQVGGGAERSGILAESQHDLTRRDAVGSLTASLPLTWMNAHGPELLATP